ncbi:Mss4p nuclear export [Ceratobasidium sp. 394]|nr:Mss4p nuclear export [Ceratobasidium sp. 394]KAG9095992.1 Mss4p nuclear export [Ceratobasidium sp. UAMH 11750]
MGKRKTSEDSDESGEEVKDLVDVDFEFFDPAQIDYLAIKRLLNQLFSLDSSNFQVEKLTELILSQPLVGSTVKTDGIESDPYALLSVININVHKDHPSIKTIVAYLLEKVAQNPVASSALEAILSPQALASPSGHTGLIISERLINMPPQIMPPMYKMLRDEVQWAIEENEPYNFENFIVISRCFRFSDEEENTLVANQPTKKQKRKGGVLRSYHAEDECIEQVGTVQADYEFTNKIPREPDSFGVDLAGRVIVFPQAEFSKLVSIMQEAFPPRRA